MVNKNKGEKNVYIVSFPNLIEPSVFKIGSFHWGSHRRGGRGGQMIMFGAHNGL